MDVFLPLKFVLFFSVFIASIIYPYVATLYISSVIVGVGAACKYLDQQMLCQFAVDSFLVKYKIILIQLY